MLKIPLQSIPAQKISVVLNGQNTQIFLYQKDENLYADISSNGKIINNCVIALNRNPLIRQKYNGFSGQIMFRDTKGVSDPMYTGFNNRYELMYLTEDEYALL